MLDNTLKDTTANVMKKLEDRLLANINCCSIGKIEAVDFEAQTVVARIVYKRVVPDMKVLKPPHLRIIDYPILLDVPFMILQGGGSYIGMPIKPGDYCLVLFCDRNFSIWWDSGAETAPEDSRKHSLSDGIAIVGINPKSSPLGYAGDLVEFYAGDNKLFLGNSTTDLLTLLSGLIDVIKGITTFGSPTSQQVSPAAQQQLDQYKTTLEQLLQAKAG